MSELFSTGPCELRLFNCTGLATTWDHIVPKGRGGDNSPENLRRACKSCNERKADRLDSELTRYDFALTDLRAHRIAAESAAEVVSSNAEPTF